MALHLPGATAVIARLPEPEINLAAYGGVVHPVAVVIEAPVIMLLAASTALSKDWPSFRTLRRYMWCMGGVLTAVHVLIAFTPLYDVIVVSLIRPPAEIVEWARVGLKIMTPWTAMIAYRRFYQGILIRFGHSRAVGLGTVLRLSVFSFVLGVGYLIGTVSGVIVAASGAILGVTAEAIFCGLRARPVLREQLEPAPLVERSLTLPVFLEFYIPLAMTSVLLYLVSPLSSAGLSRMPRPLESLAIWPVVEGLVYVFRGLGFAYNEVVVALLDEAQALRSLRRFAFFLAGLATFALLVVAASPLSDAWFRVMSGLSPKLASMAGVALWIALPVAGLTAVQSWYQGLLMHYRLTRGITESMVLLLVTVSVVLWLGVRWGSVGLNVGWVAISFGNLVQTAWLGVRSRLAMRPSQLGQG